MRKRKKKYPLTKRDIEVYSIRVLADAIRNILYDGKDTWRNETKIEDLLWLMSDDIDQAFSFLNVCEHLGIYKYQKARMVLIVLSKDKHKKYDGYRKAILQIVKDIFEDVKDEKE